MGSWSTRGRKGVAALLACAGLAACAGTPRTPAGERSDGSGGATPAAGSEHEAAKPGHPAGEEWREAESKLLVNHVQLTSRDRFVKAGEAYFSPDGEWIVFQAVPVPEEGKEADPFYAMFVGKLEKDASGKVKGLGAVTRISPEGSANTCGWFHPTDPKRVLFGSTTTRPSDEQKSGFQVGSRRYVWMFPQEMEVVEWDGFVVRGEGKDARRVGTNRAMPQPRTVFSLPNYDAECSYSADGRFILYAHIEEAPTSGGEAGGQGDHAPGKPDANIYIYDTVTKEHHAIVTAPGYDGGPFFSPDGKSICYRSDRAGNDLLQLFVADLKFEKGDDGAMVPVGIEREYQLTKNQHVNWAPYWHPSGRALVYASSEVGHTNYEVFAVEVDRAKLEELAKAAGAETRSGGQPATIDASSARRARVTHAPGADVLPAFSPDSKYLMWTGQRGPLGPGETRPSSQLWIAEAIANPFAAECEVEEGSAAK